MVDNFVTNAGSGGNTYASDDIASVHYPRVKIVWGADGVANDANATTPLPVDGSGVTQPVSGTVTANLAAGTNNIGDVDVLTLPAATNAGATAKTADFDTGAGTDTVTMFGMALPAAGGAVAGGTSTNPVRIDPTGTTTQPVSGTVTANAGSGTFTVSGTVTANAGSGTFSVDSELPAAAALADATANPTAPLVGAALEIFNGTTWDRARGDTTNGIDVDVTRLPALAAGTNNIGDIDVLSVIPGTGATALGKAEDAAHTTGDTGVYALAVRDDSPAAHSGTDGDYESLHVNTEGGLWTSPTPSASGGLSIFRSLDLDETEEDVKTTAGTVYGWYISNLATTTRYVKFYNATAATVVVGTTTPVMTLPIPGNSTDDIAANALGTHGIAFSTAICVAATTGLADADTGAPGANDVVVNLFYK